MALAKRLLPTEENRIRDLYQQGYTQKEIVQKVGRSQSAISRVVKKAKKPTKIAAAQKALQQAESAPSVLSIKTQAAISKLLTALKKDKAEQIVLNVRDGKFKITFIREEVGDATQVH